MGFRSLCTKKQGQSSQYHNCRGKDILTLEEILRYLSTVWTEHISCQYEAPPRKVPGSREDRGVQETPGETQEPLVIQLRATGGSLSITGWHYIW
jgi:hypothetical protein